MPQRLLSRSKRRSWTTTTATHSYATTTAKIIPVHAYNSTGTKVGFNQVTINP